MNAFQAVKQNNVYTIRRICSLAQCRQYDLEEVDKYGNTPLLMACYLGRMEAALLLLKAGANIRAVNYFGQNALTLATHAGHLPLVRELLRFRAYEDFNLSSIIPASCVATLCQHMDLMKFYAKLDHQIKHKGVHSVHGLTPRALQQMLNGSRAHESNRRY